jgi:large subunit ribosomal protein L5
MDICINTSASNDEEGRELLRLFGMPFRKSSSELAAEENAAAASEEPAAETAEA